MSKCFSQQIFNDCPLGSGYKRGARLLQPGGSRFTATHLGAPYLNQKVLSISER